MNPALPGKSLLQILFVEDDPADSMLIREAFRQGNFPVNVSQVCNGEECIRFLERTAPYEDAPSPHLLLLDLYMPVMGGRELIGAVLAHEEYRHLPLVILTMEDDPHWIREMYAWRCNTYIVKPWALAELNKILEVFVTYWYEVATLPESG